MCIIDTAGASLLGAIKASVCGLVLFEDQPHSLIVITESEGRVRLNLRTWTRGLYTSLLPCSGFIGEFWLCQYLVPKQISKYSVFQLLVTLTCSCSLHSFPKSLLGYLHHCCYV